jgi:hypothetical protein
MKSRILVRAETRQGAAQADVNDLDADTLAGLGGTFLSLAAE